MKKARCKPSHALLHLNCKAVCGYACVVRGQGYTASPSIACLLESHPSICLGEQGSERGNAGVPGAGGWRKFPGRSTLELYSCDLSLWVKAENTRVRHNTCRRSVCSDPTSAQDESSSRGANRGNLTLGEAPKPPSNLELRLSEPHTSAPHQRPDGGQAISESSENTRRRGENGAVLTVGSRTANPRKKQPKKRVREFSKREARYSYLNIHSVSMFTGNNCLKEAARPHLQQLENSQNILED